MRKHSRVVLWAGMVMTLVVVGSILRSSRSTQAIADAVAALRDAGVSVAVLNYIPTTKALTGSRWYTSNPVPFRPPTYSVTVPPDLATTATIERIAVLAEADVLLNVAYANPRAIAPQRVSLDDFFEDVPLSDKAKRAFRNSQGQFLIYVVPTSNPDNPPELRQRAE